jgi:hypothetical protein
MIAENPTVAQNPQGIALISSGDADNSFNGIGFSQKRGAPENETPLFTFQVLSETCLF